MGCSASYDKIGDCRFKYNIIVTPRKNDPNVEVNYLIVKFEKTCKNKFKQLRYEKLKKYKNRFIVYNSEGDQESYCYNEEKVWVVSSVITDSKDVNPTPLSPTTSMSMDSIPGTVISPSDSPAHGKGIEMLTILKGKGLSMSNIIIPSPVPSPGTSGENSPDSEVKQTNFAYADILGLNKNNIMSSRIKSKLHMYNTPVFRTTIKEEDENEIIS